MDDCGYWLLHVLGLFGLVSGSLTGVEVGWNAGGAPGLRMCKVHTQLHSLCEEGYTEIREERNSINGT